MPAGRSAPAGPIALPKGSRDRPQWLGASWIRRRRGTLRALLLIVPSLLAAFGCGGSVPTPTVVPPTSTDGLSYYVDGEVGDDAWSGTLAEPNADRSDGPWATIARANRKFGSSDSALPGHTLHLRMGQTFSGTTLEITVSGDDSPSDSVTVTGYGSSEDMPVLTGANPCISLDGSYVRIEGIETDDCGAYGTGIRVTGSHNDISSGVTGNNMQGMYLKAESSYNRVSNYTFSDNNQGDGSGSSGLGIQVRGSFHEIDHNEFLRNYWLDDNGCRRGDAIEVYAGSGETTSNNRIHDNLAIDNQTFSEMGHSNDSPPGVVEDNAYYYNVVRSSLEPTTCPGASCGGRKGTSFFVTRGEGDTVHGPVNRTTFDNNTGYFTGECSQGIVCSSCTSEGTEVLELRNNISVADWKGAFFSAAMPDEDYNIFRHTGSSGWDLQCGFDPCEVGEHSMTLDPQFLDPKDGDLHLGPTSPAVDAGVNVGYEEDFDGSPVPQDGDGDGSATTDIGAFESPSPGSTPAP